jgi:hypothetical protein
MPDQHLYNDTAYMAHERVHDLRAIAHELHALPKPEGGSCQPGRIGRVRATLGRRLISLGSAVAGQHT